MLLLSFTSNSHFPLASQLICSAIYSTSNRKENEKNEEKTAISQVSAQIVSGCFPVGGF